MNRANNTYYPPGYVQYVPYPGFTDPQGLWLKCDGSVVLRATYPNLYATIGQTFKTDTYDTGVYFQLPTQSSSGITVPTNRYAMIFGT